MNDPLVNLGWTEDDQRAWKALVTDVPPGRVARIDRGWSTLLPTEGAEGARRVRNIGAEVAVGDWVVPSADEERVEHVLPRRSALVRRASFAGAKGMAHTLAANLDVVCLLHALTARPNPRRLERELVLAFDSGAQPVVVLTKADAVDDADAALADAVLIALAVPVLVVSSRTGAGVEQIHALCAGHKTITLLGASGVGKSTLVNSLVGGAVQRIGALDSAGKGRHTTSAAELIPVPGGGWLIDTPGLRAVSLWSSGRGIERAFADVFDLTDQCRFRDCKHEDEPGCAVREAIDRGELSAERLASLKRLVAEEAVIEDEQREKERNAARRPPRTTRP